MTWYQIHLTESDVDARKHFKILKDFEVYFYQAKGVEGFALFQTQSISPFEAIFFLPPSATKYCPQLLLAYSATSCVTPERSQLKVTLGSTRALDFWFSESNND